MAVSISLASGVAQAQAQAGAAAPASDQAASEEIVVTGFRSSLLEALGKKRDSDTMIDVIGAEQVGKFPESNLAEALQRLPGITIERENGEGRTITVRGLGGDFVRTRLNGIETVASSGSNEGQTTINRTRGFDFNVFASDLFSRLTVRKSAEASVDEGSLGSTVDIDTGRPLDIGKRSISLSAQDTYYSNDKKNNPRLAGMYSDTFFNNTLGILVSGAYQKRDTGLSFYDRNPGQFEVLYRGSDLAGPVRNGTGGTFAPTCITSGAPSVTATANRSPFNCFWGFAAPTPTTTTAAPSGIGRQAFGIDANSQMFGSNPTAWGLLDSNLATTIPALTSLQQQDIAQERVGLTATLQWAPTDRTKVTVDGLYAQFDVDNQSHILGSFGLNRQFDSARAEIGLTNASTGLRPFSAANFNYFADRRGAYVTSCTTSATLDCTGTLGSPTTPVFSTAQYWNGTSYVSVPATLATTGTNGNTWSTNPYNLDTFDYYNNPGSVGYDPAAAAADHRGILMYDQIVGKPHTLIQDVHVNNAGQADYMKLDRLDWLSNDAYARNKSRFYQFDMTLEHQFSDSFKAQFVYGKSASRLRVDGGRVDIFALDKNGFVFDERDGGSMPVFNPGFNAADVSEWGNADLVKGYAGISRYVRSLDNDYQNFRGDIQYRVSDELELAFGASKRDYEFETHSSQFSRGVIPTIKELNKYGRDKGDPEYANLTLAQMGNIVKFGSGLNLPAGTPTSWFSPDRNTFERLLGYNCNCVNQFGDWRLITTLADGLNVKEADLSGYLQANFDLTVLGRPLRGNVGMRLARTKVNSTALGTSGILTGTNFTATNSYVDKLPSLNLGYEITDNLMLRAAAAKTMARPQLGNLSPGVTALSIPTTPDSGANTPRVTVGNPQLEPFRSDNYDISFEWYFQRDSLLSVALFYKKLGSFPRQQSFTAKLDEFLSPELYTALRAGLTTLTPTQAAYLDGENVWTVTSFVDSPGGYVKGVEVQYQQGFTFLPKPFDGLGIQANFTHIKSKLSYLTQQGTAATAPWPFASPYTVNATIYYEKGPFEARVSYSWRDRFATVFPQAVGTCPPGLNTAADGGVCTSPYNDFGGTEAAQYVDAKISYRISDNFRADLSVQNLFGETESQWNYDPSVVRKYSAGGGRIITLGLRFTL